MVESYTRTAQTWAQARLFVLWRSGQDDLNLYSTPAHKLRFARVIDAVRNMHVRIKFLVIKPTQLREKSYLPCRNNNPSMNSRTRRALDPPSRVSAFLRMSLKVPKANNIQLFKDGYKHLQGIEEAVMRNIQAVGELSDLVRTSFGPNGRNKLIINHLGRMFVTSDAATIIREIEVVHPAAKLLVMASQAQESEMGDATNTVLVFAGELLKKSEHLLIMGLHPSEIIIGYELACEKALAELEGLSNYNLAKPLTKESLALVLKSSIASKQYGSEDTLASLVAEAALAVMPSRPEHFNVDNVRVVKIMGGSLNSSTVVRGMVFNREPQGVIKKASKAKVAVYTCALDIAQTETKGTVLLRNAEEMLNFTRGEEQQLEKVRRHNYINASVLTSLAVFQGDRRLRRPSHCSRCRCWGTRDALP
ncbi:t-complex protein 1 [Rhizoctonia solani AG-1 IA]|uniref:T-complex protein 1 n=1 Tax=Thanatephorus cucumeris (strain AG1-IA) TaxID=983506 RepID=L8WVG3_THACA|nr:t-complex protein 1 [Rhizoctonia solani AG-1 IA]